MEVSWAERTTFHRAWSLASVSSARRLSAVKGVPRAAAIPLGTISSQPHQGSVTFRACEHRWLTEPGYVARVAAPEIPASSSSSFAHSLAFERNRHVLQLGSPELINELTQTPGGLAVVDIRAAQSVARHRVRNGVSRILDDRRAAAHFDPAQTRAAVIQSARQYRSDDTRTERQRS